MEVDFEAIEVPIRRRGLLTDSPIQGVEASVESGPKGKPKAEIESRGKGEFFCLLELLKVRQRQSVGGFLLTWTK